MQSFKINIAILLTILFWASAFVGIRVGLVSYSPGALALFRFMVASLCMLVIYHCLPLRKKIPLAHRLQLALLGVAGIAVYNLCLNYGEMSVSAGVASFIVGLMPVLTVLLSIVFLRERPSTFVYLGIGVSFLGLSLMTWAEGARTPIGHGMLVMLFAALMGALYTVLQKRFLKYYHPVAVTSWVIWGGTFVLLIFSPHLWQEIKLAKTSATIAAVYMGIFPAAIAYVAWSYVLNVLSASRAVMYLYALPLVSTLLGIVCLGEYPAKLSLLGGCLALIGSLYATRYRTLRPRLSANDQVFDQS